MAGAMAGATAGAGAVDKSQLVSQLRAIERERLTALVNADVAVLERLHAEDFELVPPTGVVMGRAEYLALVVDGGLDGGLEYERFEPLSDIEVRVHGDAATLWYSSAIDVAAEQGRLAHEAWHLYLYERRSGQWQVVREQATAIGGFPPQG